MDITSGIFKSSPTLTILAIHNAANNLLYSSQKGQTTEFGPAHTAHGNTPIPKDKMELRDSAVHQFGCHATTSEMHRVSLEMQKHLLPTNQALMDSGDKVRAL